MTAARSVVERLRPWALRRRWHVQIFTPAYVVEAWVRTRRQAEALVNAHEGVRSTEPRPDITEALGRLDPDRLAHAIAAAPCEPTRAPAQRGPVLPPDVAHAVNGPALVTRSLANRAWHYQQHGAGTGADDE